MQEHNIRIWYWKTGSLQIGALGSPDPLTYTTNVDQHWEMGRRWAMYLATR